MEQGWIDLHTHTTASDGSLTPTQLVEAAISIGLEAVAVTDHDTTDGVEEAVTAGENLGIRVVPGIEISAQIGRGTLHILGYEIDPGERMFAAWIERLKQARRDRNPKIIRNLQAMGIPIELEQAEMKAGGGVVGRPHIAEALLDIGAVSTIQEAFDKYLDASSPAYEQKFRYEPADAFQLILGAGGIPVMAHPGQTRRKGDDLYNLVAELKAAGLGGIETYYTHHTPAQCALYMELADKFNLIQTGGTDFHGHRKREIQLGWGKGNLRVPAQFLQPLDERVALIRGN